MLGYGPGLLAVLISLCVSYPLTQENIYESKRGAFFSVNMEGKVITTNKHAQTFTLITKRYQALQPTRNISVCHVSAFFVCGLSKFLSNLNVKIDGKNRF